MKKTIVLAMMAIHAFSGVASENKYDGKTSIATVGILQGGGGIVGVDYESMINNKWGVSVGLGVPSFGASVHYHFEPSITSNSIALNYWKQGFESSNSVTYLGITHVWRMTSGWSAQLGISSIVHEGEEFKRTAKRLGHNVDVNYALLYSIGYMF
jgi:hypothetical protein